MKKSKKVAKCGCGRSPSGECIGWHELTMEEYTLAKVAFDAETSKETRDNSSIAGQ